MDAEGPLLETLMRRLAECPPEFLLEPRHAGAGVIDVGAILGDHLRAIQPDVTSATLQSIVARVQSFTPRRQQLLAIVAWVLHDNWFLSRTQFGPPIQSLLTGNKLDDLSELITAQALVNDPDRREELVRTCLGELGLRPQGESLAQAKDRLTTLDSVERKRVLRKTRASEARARKIREQMAKKAAQEAAARYSPE